MELFKPQLSHLVSLSKISSIFFPQLGYTFLTNHQYLIHVDVMAETSEWSGGCVSMLGGPPSSSSSSRPPPRGESRSRSRLVTGDDKTPSSGMARRKWQITNQIQNLYHNTISRHYYAPSSRCIFLYTSNDYFLPGISKMVVKIKSSNEDVDM